MMDTCQEGQPNVETYAQFHPFKGEATPLNSHNVQFTAPNAALNVQSLGEQLDFGQSICKQTDRLPVG